jgi:hypothetical protein
LSEAILKAAGCEVEISNSRTSDGKSKLQVKAKSGFSLFGLGNAEAELGSEGEQGHSNTRSTEPLQLDPSDPNDLVRALKGIGFKKFVVLELNGEVTRILSFLPALLYRSENCARAFGFVSSLNRPGALGANSCGPKRRGSRLGTSPPWAVQGMVRRYERSDRPES